MKMYKKKRVLSLIMACMLCLSVLPQEVLAAEAVSCTEDSGQEETESVSTGNAGVSADKSIRTLANTADVSALSAANEADNTGVAEVTIGGTATKYTSICDAFTAAQEADSATVKLLSDVTITETKKGICLTKGNIAFDLNGYTLTSNSTTSYPLDIVLWISGEVGSDGAPVYATLTLQDSSQSSSGKIVQTNGIPVIEVGSLGKLIVEGGNFENISTVDKEDLISSSVSCAILTSGATIIRGGTMSGQHGVVANGGNLTVTGGTFTGTSGNALIVYEGTVSLSGGTYITSQNEHSIWVMNDGKAASLLADGYRYEKTTGGVSAYSETGSGIVGNAVVKERPQGEFAYIAADGSEAVHAGCKELTSEALYNDKDNVVGKTIWYAASGDITLSRTFSVIGTLNLILCDGATVTAPNGLTLGYTEGPGTLNIYAQSKGTGSLTVTSGGNGSRVGKTTGIKSNYEGSNLNIYGGTVTATGSTCAVYPGEDDYSGAGIGTCANDKDGKGLNVNIYGGTVIAKSGGKGAAAIGNGQAANGTVTVTIARGMKCVDTEDPTVQADYSNTDGISVTITKCSEHQWGYTQNGDKHTSECELCGTTGVTEAHTFENWQADVDTANTHTGKCVCGATTTEAHTMSLTANADGLTHAAQCSKCGHQESPAYHSFDSSTDKCACDARLAAKYNGNSYATLQSAVDAAKGNNGTVIIGAKNSGFSEEITVDSGSVTIDLNGLGEKNGWFGAPKRGTGGGALRITGGSVTLKNGTLRQGSSGPDGASAVFLEGGSLTVEENVTIAGGDRGTLGKEYAIEVSSGELTLHKGVTLELGLKVPDGRKPADYLAEGTAFAKTDGTIINGYTTGSTREDLRVVEHSHSGYTEGEDGNYYCSCGYPCQHKVGDDGKCKTCGVQTVAKIGEDGYLSVAEALDAVENGGTITLLTDVKEDVSVAAGKDVIFDFNGHTWENSGTFHTMNVYGSVTMTGNGTMKNNSKNGSDIAVWEGGKLHLENGMTLYKVWADTNTSVTLDAGVVITNNIFSRGGSDIFFLFTGKALQRYDLNNKQPVADSYVPLNKDYASYGPTGCVIVIEHPQHVFEKGTTGYCDICGAACDHANMKVTDPVCPDCHAEYVAGVVITDVNGTTYQERFTVLREALVYANRFSIGGNYVKKAELTLFKDATENDEYSIDMLWEGIALDINLNGKTLTWAGRSLNIKGGKVRIHDGNIDCTNKDSLQAIYVTDVNRYKPELTLENVKITTEPGTSSVYIHDGKLTIQGEEGHYSVLEVYEGSNVQLSGGSFDGIKILSNTFEGNVFTSMLAEGYIYVDENGDFLAEETLKQQAAANQNDGKGYCTNAVRVVKCTDHSYQNSQCTKCGFVCPHDKIENGTCVICHTTFVATITGADGKITGCLDADTAIGTLAASNGGTMKLYDDAGYTKTVTLEHVTATMELNGHTISGENTDKEETAAGRICLGENANLTIRDASTARTGSIAGLTVDAQAALVVESGHVKDLVVNSAAAEITFQPGSSLGEYKIVPGKMIPADWMEEGCFIYDTGADGTSADAVMLTDREKTALGKFVIGKVQAQFTVGEKTGELPYGNSVSAALCPGVTLKNAADYQNLGAVSVAWYRRSDSGSKCIGSGTIQNGTYVANDMTPDFSGVKSGDKLDVFCTITVMDTGDKPFWQTVLSDYALTVKKADPVVTALPTVAERVYDPDGILKDADLAGGTVSVAGSWHFSGTNIVPTVDNTGYEAVFTPDDTENYNTVTKKITVKVTKAALYIAEKPTAAAITYGDTLASSVLTGGRATDQEENGKEIAGSFAWKQGEQKPAVSDSGVTVYEVTFVPADAVNYATAAAKLTLTVNKAAKAPNMPEHTMQPAHRLAKVGEITLPKGWSWSEADREKVLADKVAVTATAHYTGADKGNYETESVSITITRKECTHENTEIRNQKSATCTQTGFSGDIYCADCGILLETGRETAASGHDYQSAVTKEPTREQEGIRTYTCSRCHISYTESIARLPEGRHNHDYAESITKQATCTDTGVKTFYCSCGDSYTEVIPAMGHSYVSKVTRAATAETEGIMTYTCTRCGYSDTQLIARLRRVAAGDTTDTAGEITENGNDREAENTTTKESTVSGEDTKEQPYLKDDSAKEGWDVISEQLDHSEAGASVTVAMNGATVVPESIFESIRGKDVTLVLDLGNGITWKINGENVTALVGDIDFGVITGEQAGRRIPVDVINRVSGERYSMNLTLAYHGEFGFEASLTVQMDARNAGLYANLFYYNEQSGNTEFVSAGQIGTDGNAELTFTHASDYIIVVDTVILSDNAVADGEIGTGADGFAHTGAGIVIAGIGILLILLGAVLYLKNRRKDSKE